MFERNFGHDSRAKATKISESSSEARPLTNPPQIIKAIYFTALSGGSDKKISYLLDLAKTNGINAVVIDIKDYSGYISYDTSVPDVKRYKSEDITIHDVDALITRLHEQGIYAIARLTVFQDPTLARARPDLAVRNGSQTWYDGKGLAWIDPAAKDAWDYNIAIAKDASAKGFDEINFDYVRFPSDGNIEAIKYPFWDGKTPKSQVIRSFFKYLRENLEGVKISADLFGFTTIHKDDLGIGQVIENAFAYFDYVCPMVYPSHYPLTFLGYPNPAEHPYDVIKNAMDGGITKLEAYRQSRIKRGLDYNKSEIRPWLQDFDLGADYNVGMINAEIKAVTDTEGNNFKGFMLWNASNNYTPGISKN